MSHYAKVIDGKVTEVIVAEPDFFNTFIDTSPGTWLQTSYNTYGNAYKLGGTPLRGNFAGIGYTYDATNDVFIPPKPFTSWVLNHDTYLWSAPTPMSSDNKHYGWDESTTSWIEVIS